MTSHRPIYGQSSERFEQQRGPVEFEYENQKKWSQEFPECNGRSQSPINIIPDQMISNSRVVFGEGYYRPLRGTLKNTGHTAEVDLEPKPSLEFNGESYSLQQLHFHWGNNDYEGSEHAIDGNKYSLEMHLVHLNRRFRRLQDAAGKRNGLLVVAVLFHLSRRNNRNIDFVIEDLEEIRRFNSSREVNVRPLTSIVPLQDATSLFSYTGSLTTPPCSQEVQWLIFPDQPPVSSEQLNEFRKIQDRKREEVRENFRNLQFINDRRVLNVLL